MGCAVSKPTVCIHKARNLYHIVKVCDRNGGLVTCGCFFTFDEALVQLTKVKNGHDFSWKRYEC